ncbi:hypothetical protein TNCV_2601731 [Trichonephila clavipes]|nr:hypothetical protein TNCV_2601731 [Trichonephila clavipes]
MRRVSQHIVPRMLNDDQSADEVKSASQTELKDMNKYGSQKCVSMTFASDGKSVLLLKGLISKGDVFQQLIGDIF